jgi:hypothetical protein
VRVARQVSRYDRRGALSAWSRDCCWESGLAPAVPGCDVLMDSADPRAGGEGAPARSNVH